MSTSPDSVTGPPDRREPGRRSAQDTRRFSVPPGCPIGESAVHRPPTFSTDDPRPAAQADRFAGFET
jgi:hypothetical protein